MQHDSKSPLSFSVSIVRLPAKGMPVGIRPDERQRARLAADHGLIAVNRLDAELLVSNWKKDGIRVRGTIAAEIVQNCVISLVEITQRIATELDVILVPEGSHISRVEPESSGELFLDAEGDDLPDTFSGSEIDVGALVEEYFELAIDPYPRAPGASLSAAPEKEVEKPESPFAKLSELKPKR